jgi:hypothetical protein
LSVLQGFAIPIATKTCVALLLLPVALPLLVVGSSPASTAQLVEGYKNKTCPNVEAIVREEMEKIISAAPSLAGPLLRLHFHDCFVRVSRDVSLLFLHIYTVTLPVIYKLL